MNRLVAVGDIHGQKDMLHRLLNMIQPTAHDQFIFLGDYVDRGSDSRGVLTRLMEFQDEFPHTVFLRGNHDQLLLDVLAGFGVRIDKVLENPSIFNDRDEQIRTLELFYRNGGQATLRSYQLQEMKDFPLNHISFLESTRLWWTFENFIFTHAGIDPDIHLEDQDRHTLLWKRSSRPGRNGKIHVVGHCQTRDALPCFEQGRYVLDTGAGYGQNLTACDVLTRDYWQAKY